MLQRLLQRFNVSHLIIDIRLSLFCSTRCPDLIPLGRVVFSVFVPHRFEFVLELVVQSFLALYEVGDPFLARS